MTQTADKTLTRNTNRLRLIAWALAAGLMAVPLIAMQFTREVNWTGSDFAIFGAMLLVACSAFELTLRLTRNRAHYLLAGVIIAGLFVLVWAELAVGIFN